MTLCLITCLDQTEGCCRCCLFPAALARRNRLIQLVRALWSDCSARVASLLCEPLPRPAERCFRAEARGCDVYHNRPPLGRVTLTSSRGQLTLSQLSLSESAARQGWRGRQSEIDRTEATASATTPSTRCHSIIPWIQWWFTSIRRLRSQSSRLT